MTTPGDQSPTLAAALEEYYSSAPFGNTGTALAKSAKAEIDRLTLALAASERQLGLLDDAQTEMDKAQGALHAANVALRERCEAAEAERGSLREQLARLAGALEAIAELQYSEAGEPLDEAIDLAKAALAERDAARKRAEEDAHG